MDVKQRRCLIKRLILGLAFLCFAGCSGPAPQAPATTPAAPAEPSASRLTLAYEVGQAATYRLSSEAIRSVRFEGIRPDNKTLGAFDSAMTGRLSDVTWAQTVQAVDPNGQALIWVKILSLTYTGYRMGEMVVDYDSARAQNDPTAMEDLIGLVYHVRVDVKGQVVDVVGEKEAQARLDENKAHFANARRLLTEETIRARHTIKPLNAAPDEVITKATWTSPESFVFGRMGGKAFEKTYECQPAEKDSALVEITLSGFGSVDNSVSGVEAPGMPFTSEDQLTGTLTLDTRTGQVKAYQESLEVNWSFVDPASVNEAEPRAGHMTAKQAFLLERKESVP